MLHHTKSSRTQAARKNPPLGQDGAVPKFLSPRRGELNPEGVPAGANSADPLARADLLR